MKKRIYVLILFVLSLFMFSGRVVAANGTTMWLNCKGDDGKQIATYFRYGKDGEWRVYFDNAGSYFYNYAYPIQSCWLYDNAGLHNVTNGYNQITECPKNSYSFSYSEMNSLLSQGVCPGWVHVPTRSPFNPSDNAVLIGKGGTMLGSASLDDDEYIIYSLKFGNQDFYAIEFYDINGKYYVVIVEGEHGSAWFLEEWDVLNLVEKLTGGFLQGPELTGTIQHVASKESYGKDYFRVGHNKSYLANFIKKNKDMFGVVGKPSSYDVVLDSGDNQYKLEKLVDNWYKSNKENIEKESSIVNSSSDKNLINACTEFNEKAAANKNYQFSSSYTAQNMLNDLNSFSSRLSTLDDVKNNYKLCSDGRSAEYLKSASNCVLYNAFGKNLPKNKINSKSEDAIETFNAMLEADIKKIMKEKNYIDVDASKKINSQLETLGKCSAYLDKYASTYGLNSEDTSRVREAYEKYAIDKGIDIVIDCEGLLGQPLVDKIKSYLNIFKYAVMIILIGYGIIDFTKAILGKDDNDMKKAQTDFIKRVGIAILIFFVPTVIELILNVANEVWKFVSPDTCGLF